jgi:flagellar motor switch protein FliM
MSMSELVAREVLAVKPTVTLNVIAGSTEMSLKQLTDLDVGDVVLLNTKLDSGFYVTNKNGVNLAKVHLGKQANQKVIQLIE